MNTYFLVNEDVHEAVCIDGGENYKLIKLAEQEKAELLKQVATEEQNWAQARSIRNMEALMAQYRIEMAWPAEKDIIRLHAARPDQPVEYARR